MMTTTGTRGRRRARGNVGARALVSFRRANLRAWGAGVVRRGLRPTGRVAEAGAATAEYAMVILAAAAFSGVLIKIITSGTVKGLLTGIVTRALT